MVTNLDSKLYLPGDIIVERKQKVEALYLIKKGLCYLNAYFP